MNINQFCTDIVMNGGWNYFDLYKHYQLVSDSSNITFKQWFKKHLKEEYLLSDYGTRKVIETFDNEIDERIENIERYFSNND